MLVHREKVLSWVPPTQGKVNLNFDGALFRSSGTVGLGVRVCNKKSEVLPAMCRKEVVMFEVDDAEAMAAPRSTDGFTSGFFSFDSGRGFFGGY